MSEGSIENMIKADSNFGPSFIEHHLLPDMNFNGQFNRENNFYP